MSKIGMRFGLFMMVLVFLVSCDPRQERVLESLVALDEGDGKAADPARVEELKKEIAQSDDTVQKLLTQAQKTGTFWRQLGLEYFSLEMYQLSYDALVQALQIYPQSPSVFYYMGLSASQLSRTQLDAGQRDRWLSLAVAHHKSALEFRPNFTEVLYALSLLYSFETEQPEMADPLLNRLIPLTPTDDRALMLQARVSYQMGEISLAMEQYGKLAREAKDPGMRTSAAQNLAQIRSGQ